MASAIEKTIRKTVTSGIMGVSKVSAALKTRSDDHPYLTGVHKPMEAELTLTELEVDGAIPAELDGRYLRIGPNPVTPPNAATYHWFLGDGMAHGLRIRNGKAEWYRNRWIRSEAVSRALGEPMVPCPEDRERGSANTNIVGQNGRTWAIVEAGNSPVELSEELETLAINPFDGTLKGPFSAHPHLDPESGEMHSICYKGDVADTVWHTVVGPDGKVVREEPISVEHGPSIHDCAITKNYVIVLDLPVTFSMKTLISGHGFPYRWNPDHKARVGLMPRSGSNADVIWHDVAPCYAFHPCNAFENADGSITMDIVTHDRMFAEGYDGPDGSQSAFERWTIDAKGGVVERSVIDDTNQEFPRFDERLTGKPYRYAYCMASEDSESVPGLINDTRLFKYDLEAGTRETHDFGAHRHPGEFVFVPRGAGEQEGWLVGLVVDMNTDSTDFAILDAANFTGDPVARVRLPHRIPPGFHGNWVDAA
ncbi:carotenoid oxygenase family protein [Parasphingopyxis lamellibrachiae]|uniref:Dioxygenase n=1 Tax=Parasphingopyxis lamellibrachiae TaxID=680125 RepID=A0A3D9FFB1_9SPHN|nr:carotenoid oxygenase family protein [Parasphingopyxis lamellibrachiae]RED15786.1 carotenoid cleavage dioxygenase [Parasphingopyxis lamellibrachiae]